MAPRPSRTPRVDVRALGCDFYAFSGHKLYGPTGIGVLYGREELLAAMPPWQGGGDMILTVSFEKTTYNELPWKFEAGTPNISGAVGLAAAMDYVESLGLEAIAAHEHRLLEHATRELERIPGIEIIGTAHHKAAVLSFTMTGVHPHDLGTILDARGGRGAYRPPLRHARDDVLRHTGDGARLLRLL